MTRIIALVLICHVVCSAAAGKPTSSSVSQLGQALRGLCDQELNYQKFSKLFSNNSTAFTTSLVDGKYLTNSQCSKLFIMEEFFGERA